MDGPRAPVICTGFPPPGPSPLSSVLEQFVSALAGVSTRQRQFYSLNNDRLTLLYRAVRSKRLEFTHVCLTPSTQNKLTFRVTLLVCMSIMDIHIAENVNMSH
jgi:hypothetical protein